MPANRDDRDRPSHTILTGASGVLGGAIARELARENLALRAGTRTPRPSPASARILRLHAFTGAETLSRRAGALGDRGVAIETVVADLREEAGAAALVDGVERLELLVLAHGAYRRAPLEQTDAALIDELMAVQLRASLLTIRAALPALRAAGGQVIALTDIAASRPWRDHAAYAASKAALAHALRGLALELAPTVRINAVAPGLVEGAMAVDASTFAALERRIPAGRATTADEIAAAVVALARAPVTGQALAVDGGRSLGRRGPPPDGEH